MIEDFLYRIQFHIRKMLVQHFEPTFGLCKQTLILAIVIAVTAVLNTHGEDIPIVI
jgi:hypothetical protein